MSASSSGKRRELISPYTPDEIYHRFRETVGWPLFSVRRVIGLYDRMGFRLHVNTGLGASQVIYGRMKAQSAQSRISCAVRMPLSARLLLAVWFGLLFLALAYDLGRVLNGAPLIQNLPAIAVPLLLIVAAAGVLYLNRARARLEVDELYAFLEDTIDATPV